MDQREQRHLELFIVLQKLATAIVGLVNQPDEILHEAALLRLTNIRDEVQSLADGKVVFSATEAWRTVYERILRSQSVRYYRSVGWLKNEDYWQDAPGRSSMQLNYDLLEEGVRIERLLILSDFFWPASALLPSADIRHWIDEQYQRGILIGLIRESDIDAEPSLRCDFGIYGDRATGLWELDDQCRTVRFTLDFSEQSIRLAMERWRGLSLYAISYADLLDRAILIG